MTSAMGLGESAQSAKAVGHQTELDGIRGIAILVVLLSHSIVSIGVLRLHHPHTIAGGILARLFVPGWGGVDLFFVLSGFLITSILLRARENSTYFSSFYARRVLRISRFTTLP